MEYKINWTHEQLDKEIEHLTALELPSSLRSVTKRSKIDLYHYLKDLKIKGRGL
jgi:hypothetical protein